MPWNSQKTRFRLWLAIYSKISQEEKRQNRKSKMVSCFLHSLCRPLFWTGKVSDALDGTLMGVGAGLTGLGISMWRFFRRGNYMLIMQHLLIDIM